jgi:hypothetical protein
MLMPVDAIRQHITTGGRTPMKVLFALRNSVAARKSMKASAWYFWY